MRNWRSIGKHRLAIESDIVFWESHGSTELDEAVEFYRLVDQITAQNRWMALVVDAREAGLPTSAARRYIADWERANPQPAGVLIYVGAGVVLRSLGALVARGLELLNPQRDYKKVYWVATEAEALALVATLRPSPP